VLERPERPTGILFRSFSRGGEMENEEGGGLDGECARKGETDRTGKGWLEGLYNHLLLFFKATPSDPWKVKDGL